MVSTVDGLVSGLSTSSMIDQLMQVEASGQTQLKNRISTQQQSVASRLAVNSSVSALLTSARALTSSATWNATKARVGIVPNVAGRSFNPMWSRLPMKPAFPKPPNASE